MKESKYKKALQGADFEKAYSIDEAIETILSQPKRKFIENMDISVVLGIDPKKADQNLRGSLTLHCLLYTSPSPRDKRQSRMQSSA